MMMGIIIEIIIMVIMIILMMIIRIKIMITNNNGSINSEQVCSTLRWDYRINDNSALASGRVRESAKAPGLARPTFASEGGNRQQTNGSKVYCVLSTENCQRHQNHFLPLARREKA